MILLQQAPRQVVGAVSLSSSRLASRKHFQLLSTTTITTTRRLKATHAVGIIQSVPLGRRLWTSYTSALEHHPLWTKTTAAGLIFFSSDSATQALTARDDEYDLSRASSGAAFGVLATCWLHVWWGFLETVIGAQIPAARHRLANTLTKVAIDQGVGAPLYIYSYYIITCTLQKVLGQNNSNNKSVSDILKETEARSRQMLWPTMMTHWKIWPMVHSLNFYFIPLQHRVLVQNTMLVGWSGYLSHLNNSSAASPPTTKTDGGKLVALRKEIMATTIQRHNTIQAAALL